MSYRGHGPESGGAQPGYMQAALSERLPLIQKVYSLLLASILVAIGAGWMVLRTPAVSVPTDGGVLLIPSGVLAVGNASLVIWGALIAMLFLGRRVAMIPGLGVVFLFAFTGICGAWVAPRIWVETTLNGSPGVVGMAGALTALMFVSLSAIAYFTKKDFSFLGWGISLAFIGLIGASLLNVFFFKSGWAATMITWGVLVLSCGCILYNTSVMLRHMREEHVVLMTIGLFVDILNLFMSLLRILGGNRN